MTLSTHIISGFHLDEAIAMIDLCRRTRELFTHAPTVITPPGQAAAVTDWRARPIKRSIRMTGNMSMPLATP
jgi:hypothetical protein